jgi:protein SCO1/2
MRLAPALVALAAATVALPSTAGAVETAAAVVAGSPRRFPNPVLVTHEGKPVRFYDDLVRGRVVVVSFSYTRCLGACPLATARLIDLQRLLGVSFGRDVTFLTLSLDPEHDTPEAMSRYLVAHGSRPGWTWLTGRREDLEAIRRFVGFVDRDPRVDADRTQHATLFLMGNDRTGRWSSIPGLVPPRQILAALMRLARERGGARAPAADLPGALAASPDGASGSSSGGLTPPPGLP